MPSSKRPGPSSEKGPDSTDPENAHEFYRATPGRNPTYRGSSYKGNEGSTKISPGTSSNPVKKTRASRGNPDDNLLIEALYKDIKPCSCGNGHCFGDTQPSTELGVGRSVSSTTTGKPDPPLKLCVFCNKTKPFPVASYRTAFLNHLRVHSSSNSFQREGQSATIYRCISAFVKLGWSNHNDYYVNCLMANTAVAALKNLTGPSYELQNQMAQLFDVSQLNFFEVPHTSPSLRKHAHYLAQCIFNVLKTKLKTAVSVSVGFDGCSTSTRRKGFTAIVIYWIDPRDMSTHRHLIDFAPEGSVLLSDGTWRNPRTAPELTQKISNALIDLEVFDKLSFVAGDNSNVNLAMSSIPHSSNPLVFNHKTSSVEGSTATIPFTPSNSYADCPLHIIHLDVVQFVKLIKDSVLIPSHNGESNKLAILELQRLMRKLRHSQKCFNIWKVICKQLGKPVIVMPLENKSKWANFAHFLSSCYEYRDAIKFLSDALKFEYTFSDQFWVCIFNLGKIFNVYKAFNEAFLSDSSFNARNLVLSFHLIYELENEMGLFASIANVSNNSIMTSLVEPLLQIVGMKLRDYTNFLKTKRMEIVKLMLIPANLGLFRYGKFVHWLRVREMFGDQTTKEGKIQGILISLFLSCPSLSLPAASRYIPFYIKEPEVKSGQPASPSDSIFSSPRESDTEENPKEPENKRQRVDFPAVQLASELTNFIPECMEKKDKSLTYIRGGIPIVQLESNVQTHTLDFWKTHNTVYPILASIACCVLALPASTAAGKTELSVMRDDFGTIKSQLTAQTLRNIALIKELPQLDESGLDKVKTEFAILCRRKEDLKDDTLDSLEHQDCLDEVNDSEDDDDNFYDDDNDGNMNLDNDKNNDNNYDDEEDRFGFNQPPLQRGSPAIERSSSSPISTDYFISKSAASMIESYRKARANPASSAVTAPSPSTTESNNKGESTLPPPDPDRNESNSA